MKEEFENLYDTKTPPANKIITKIDSLGYNVIPMKENDGFIAVVYFPSGKHKVGKIKYTHRDTCLIKTYQSIWKKLYIV